MQLRRALLMTFLISLVFASVAYFVCVQFLSTNPYVHELKLVIASVYMWLPGICALIYSRQEGIKLKFFKKPSRYFWHALWIPLIIVALGVLVTALFEKFSIEAVLQVARNYQLTFSSPLLNVAIFVLVLYVIGVFASLTFNFLFALGEELFWRGYLWEKIKHLGFWRASLAIGLLWGIWHAPVIVLFGHNYPQHPLLGMIWMVVFSVLMTPIFLYLRIKDDSLMAPTVLHGMINAFCPICTVFFPGGRELLVAPLGIGGILALLLMNGYFLRSRVKILLSSRSL